MANMKWVASKLLVEGDFTHFGQPESSHTCGWGLGNYIGEGGWVPYNPESEDSEVIAFDNDPGFNYAKLTGAALPEGVSISVQGTTIPFDTSMNSSTITDIDLASFDTVSQFYRQSGEEQSFICHPEIHRLWAVNFYSTWYGPDIPFPTGITLHLGVESLEQDWLDNDFSCRRKITVKKESVTGFPADIQVMVKFDEDSYDYALITALRFGNSGALLRVRTADTEEELPWEAATYPMADGRVGAILFFKAPQLSSSADTDFYLYYGNQGDEPTLNSIAVWEPSRVKVWHENFEVLQWIREGGR